MKRKMTIGYQNRQGRGYGGSGIGSLSRDLPTSPKLVIANHFLKKLAGFSIGDKIMVTYSPGSIIISKLTA
ncbi:MAG: hypothetical protein Q7S04_01410 [Candidatus Moranbacteria bacterium]|nr:hypothetical protein [Candidatus Moranbacteria bacterium]